MVLINLAHTQQAIRCPVLLFHLSLEDPILSHMQFQLVRFMDLSELSHRPHSLVTGVLGLVVVMLVVLLGVTWLISKLQDFPGDDFKSQGSHVAYNVADFSMQVCFLLFYIF
ncbi:hypothetical protein BHM03_00000326 [Ensete ventricosum]|nr:hypothetical protein BHM03_00000326 [Ensete ventricosum]